MIRCVIGIISLTGLVIVFVFQKTDVVSYFNARIDSTLGFVINRTIRFLLNDIFAIGLIYALFVEKKYLIFALWVQLMGVFLFLIPYFLIRVYIPTYDGPLISYLHRLILNPTLLLLLLPSFYYQRKMQAS